MKRRIPDSFEHAITEIRAELGDGECAQITGRSASLILKASDPDQDYMLPLHLGLKLDEAYLKKTGQMPPIMRFWARELEMYNMAEDPDDGDIIQCALLLQKGNGEFSDKISRFTSADSQGGKQISMNEGTVLLQVLDDMEREIQMTKKKLRGGMASLQPKLVKET